jgi:endoglucanase
MHRLKATGHPNQVFFAATTQEEIGSRGARTAADVIRPDLGISIEAGITAQGHGRNPEETQGRMGAGPSVFLYDYSQLPNRRLVALIKAVAGAKAIPLQFDLVQNYIDDSAEIQKSGSGVPTVNLAVPVRYTHSHNGIIDRADFDAMVDLVVSLIQKLDGETVAAVRDFEPRP